jgi:hypothetical protein
MSAEHNRWIIASHRFHEHNTIESAEAEFERLKAQHPEKHFRLYRIKRVLKPADQAAE